MIPVVALLGRPDKPSDGVQDYCEFLSRALAAQGVIMTAARVDWFQKGWLGALLELWHSAKQWRGNWVILQYTALAWSHRGFPIGVLLVVGILRLRGAMCSIFYHEPYYQQGSGRLRGHCQSWVIRRLYSCADKAIFPDSLETVSWIPKHETKAAFIPIGSNVPQIGPTLASTEQNGESKTVAVFCLSGPPNDSMEIEDISHAAKCAAERGLILQITFLGRGTSEAEKQIQNAFRDIPVEVFILGLVSLNEVGTVLARSDAMLCVRGVITPRRGSAIAGIASGLPIVGYQGMETGFPITEAGIKLVPYRDQRALANALCDVLTNDQLREQLGLRSRRAHADHFSWERIAKRFVDELSAR